uniref:Pre-mRNA splicing Prp18-interacting factor n=1 Tax=Tanacetum cinerariifolium TaxID=118510 RepID=A0A6L2JFA0_TANCI|nr:hypothetical protein [Tanacetum cinerariifolium]
MTSFGYRLNPVYPIKECSCCGALYTTDYCCSIGILRDKIICDLDKTPDLSQQSHQNYRKCGNPVNDHYCQGCAFLRKKFKEDLFTSGMEHGILQDSFELSNDNPNVVNAPREPFVVNQDLDNNSSQSPSQINHHCCYVCGDPLEEPFNNQTIKELPQTVQSFDPKSDLVHNSPDVFDPPPELPFIACEFCGNNTRYGHYYTPQVPFIYPEPCYNQDLNIPQEFQDFYDFQQQDICCENCEEEENKIEEEQAANARYWKIPACYDDDDDYAFAITPNEPVNSLSMGDEHLDTVPATKSDEFIKSSVENLVSIPSESKDLLKEIYSNPLFEEEIIPMKIYQHHYNAESDIIESLRTHDSSIIISSKIDSLLDEFAGELTLLKSIPPGIDETICYLEEETHFIKRLLYDNSSPRPPKEFVSANSDTEIESFSPSPILVEDSDSLIEEIDLSFTPDYRMLPGIKYDDYDSERDILIAEDLLSNDFLSLPENESFHFDIPSFSRPPAKPPDGNTGILNVKMMGDIFEQKVPMPKLMITLVPNQEKSLDLLSHQGLKAFRLLLNSR